MDGFVTTQLVYVAAKLRPDEVLADGPRSGDEIADEVGAQPAPLVRLLRGLVTDDVLAEEADGRFSLTEVRRSLSTLRGAAVVRAELYYSAASGLLEAVLGGGTPFERAHGAAFFDHLRHRIAPARSAWTCACWCCSGRGNARKPSSAPSAKARGSAGADRDDRVPGGARRH